MRKKSACEAAVIVPTFNEQENIGRLVRGLLKMGYCVIVADGGSSDGTEKEVLAIGDRRAVFLRSPGGRRRGLSDSVMDAALAADAEKIIVMDADFQHPLEKVPELAAALDNSEMAVGCRTKNENWGLGRQVISLGGNWTARAVFALRGSASCSDPVSGFFGFRKSLLGKISRRRVVGEGFKVLVDVLKQLGKGTKIAEVPYVFVGRDGGGSKFRARHALLFLKSLLS